MVTNDLTRRDLFRRAAAVGAVAIGGSVLLGACERRQDAAAGGLSLDAMREAGVVNVGLANEIPHGYIDDSGELAGQSPAVARAVFKELGVENIRPVPVAWDGLIPGLTQSRLFDVIAAGMFITPERCQVVRFSEPTAQSPEAFMVAKGNPHGIETFKSFVENPDAKVAILNGSVEQTYAKNFDVPDAQIELIPDQATGFDLLRAGRVDAISMLHVSHVFLLRERGGDFEVTEPFFPKIDGEEQRGVGAFAFRQEDTELVDEVNRVLAKFKENGKLLELGKKWGFNEESLPTDITTENLCTKA